MKEYTLDGVTFFKSEEYFTVPYEMGDTIGWFKTKDLDRVFEFVEMLKQNSRV